MQTELGIDATVDMDIDGNWIKNEKMMTAHDKAIDERLKKTRRELGR